MEALWTAIKSFDYSGIPIVKIVLVIIVLMVTQVMRRFFADIIGKQLEHLTAKTKTPLDDELVQILKPSISIVILLAGFWAIQLILSDSLSPQVNEGISSILNVLLMVVVAYAVYRSSSVLGQLLANVILHTDTELDEVLRPVLPKVFQAIAIVAIAIKLSEIFFGQSSGALLGLLGGAGITLGLLFKDLIYDWFCTVIIYIDKLYKAGDWITMPEVNGFIEVVDVGFRSTTLHLILWGSIVKIPNSKMIAGDIENWSQNPGNVVRWGLLGTVKLERVSSEQIARICASIRELPKSIEGMNPDVAIVRFIGLEGNARVITVQTSVMDANLYYVAEEKLNLGILQLLEQEGIDTLNYVVEISSSLETYQRDVKAHRN